MAWWRHRTKTGKITYLKKHVPFRWRDLARIATKMPLEFEEYFDPKTKRTDLEAYYCRVVLAECLRRLAGSPFHRVIDFLEDREEDPENPLWFTDYERYRKFVRWIVDGVFDTIRDGLQLLKQLRDRLGS